MIIGTIKEVWRYPVKSMAGERLHDCAVESLGIPGDRGWALRDETTREITNGKLVPLLMQCAAQYREEPTNGFIPPVHITLPDGTFIGSDDPDINPRLSEMLRKKVTLWPLQPASNKAHYRRAGASARIAGRLSRLSSFGSLLPTLMSFGTMNRQLRQVFGRESGEPIPDISILPTEVLEYTSPPGTYFDAFPIHVLTTASLEAMTRLNSSAAWDVRRFRPNFLISTNEDIQGLAESAWHGRILRAANVELKCEIPTARCGMTTHAQRGLPKDPSVLRSIVKEANQNMGVYASVIKSGRISGDQIQLL